MPNIDELKRSLCEKERALVDVRRSLWNASQMRYARGVFRLQSQLDRLVDECRALRRQVALHYSGKRLP